VGAVVDQRCNKDLGSDAVQVECTCALVNPTAFSPAQVQSSPSFVDIASAAAARRGLIGGPARPVASGAGHLRLPVSARATQLELLKGYGRLSQPPLTVLLLAITAPPMVVCQQCVMYCHTAGICASHLHPAHQPTGRPPTSWRERAHRRSSRSVCLHARDTKDEDVGMLEANLQLLPCIVTGWKANCAC
jgi:hypothetical protein